MEKHTSENSENASNAQGRKRVRIRKRVKLGRSKKSKQKSRIAKAKKIFLTLMLILIIATFVGAVVVLLIKNGLENPKVKQKKRASYLYKKPEIEVALLKGVSKFAWLKTGSHIL